MEPAERRSSIEYYARLLNAHLVVAERIEKRAQQAEHFVHRRIRRSSWSSRGREISHHVREDLKAIFDEIDASGLTREEVKRWVLVMRYESGGFPGGADILGNVGGHRWAERVEGLSRSARSRVCGGLRPVRIWVRQEGRPDTKR